MNKIYSIFISDQSYGMLTPDRVSLLGSYTSLDVARTKMMNFVERVEKALSDTYEYTKKVNLEQGYCNDAIMEVIFKYDVKERQIFIVEQNLNPSDDEDAITLYVK